MYQIGLCGCRSIQVIVPLATERKDQEDALHNTNASDKVPEPATQSDDEDLLKDLAETGFLPTDDSLNAGDADNLEEPDSSDDESSIVANDSRENNFVDENLDDMNVAQDTQEKIWILWTLVMLKHWEKIWILWTRVMLKHWESLWTKILHRMMTKAMNLKIMTVMS